MEFFRKVPTIRFMELRRYWYVLSAAVVLGSIALVMLRGLNLTVDFTGGVEMEVGFAQPVDLESARAVLEEAGLEEFQVQNFGTANDLLVRLPPVERGASQALADRVLGVNASVDFPVIAPPAEVKK